MKKIFLIFMISFSTIASEISLELGQYSTRYNYFQKPNVDANRVDLPKGDDNFYYRFRVFYDLKNDWQIYGLFAPLQIEYNFNSDKNFVYNNKSFTKGRTKVEYKFNSYRLGMLKKFKRDNFDWWAGGTIKVRDANIIVSQGNNSSDKFSNIGFVPLLSLGAEWYFNEHMGLWTHIDGLAASQGSAYDMNLELRFRIEGDNFVSLGKRFLGGGADNDELKNFALFESTYMNFIYSF